MLELYVHEDEIFLPSQNKFITVPSCTLTLEHSLISLAKWESKWHIPYLDGKKKTPVQELDYIRCMVVGQIKNDNVFSVLDAGHISRILDYMNDSMTATTFPKRNHRMSKEVVTAESIYARMFAQNIPLECQKWHLNRLLTLIKACETKNGGPSSKMSKKDTMAYYSQQNALRRAKYKTKG